MDRDKLKQFLIDHKATQEGTKDVGMELMDYIVKRWFRTKEGDMSAIEKNVGNVVASLLRIAQSIVEGTEAYQETIEEIGESGIAAMSEEQLQQMAEAKALRKYKERKEDKDEAIDVSW